MLGPNELVGVKLGFMLGFELGAVDSLLLGDRLLDGPALGSLLGMPERLGCEDGSLLGTAALLGSTLGLPLGASDMLGCEDGLSLGIPVGEDDPVGVGACDPLG